MKRLLTITMIAGIALTSCKKKGCTDPAANNYNPDAKKDDGTCVYDPPPTGGEISTQIKFHVHHKVGTQNFSFDSTYTASNGRKYKFSRAQFYLGNIMFDQEGTWEAPDVAYAIINPGQMEYLFDGLPVKHYHGFDALVGIDSVTNHADPSTYAASHPLAPQVPSLHWGWSSGYIFVALEGDCDTTAAMTGAVNAPFEMHIGTDAMKQSLSFTKHFNATAGAAFEIHMTVDWGKFFDNVDFATEHTTHTMDNMPLATKISGNSANVLTLN